LEFFLAPKSHWRKPAAGNFQSACRLVQAKELGADFFIPRLINMEMGGRPQLLIEYGAIVGID
jgi:hypothetical protein